MTEQISTTPPPPAKPKPGKNRKQKKYATVKHPTVEAVVEGMYYFADKDKAVARIDQLRQTFVGKKLADDAKPDKESFSLWIRGFGVESDDKKSGYRGHYATIRVVKGNDNLWTLTAEKEEVPLHKHPQRQRPKYSHPDWNHPIMRSVKAGRMYDNYEEVVGELETLHVEFPDVTIPGKDKLHLIIYEGKDSETYTKKYLLKLEPAGEGQYIIVAEAKEAAPAKRKLRQQKAEGQPESMGKFTAKVRNEKLRKRK